MVRAVREIDPCPSTNMGLISVSRCPPVLATDTLVIIQTSQPEPHHRFTGIKYLTGPCDGPVDDNHRYSLVAAGRQPGNDLLFMTESDRTLMTAGIVNVLEYFNINQWSESHRSGCITLQAKQLQNVALTGQVVSNTNMS